MAELATTARPYARAAFQSASAGQALPGWSAFLARAAAVVQDEQVAALIGSPRVAPADLAAFVAELGSTAFATATTASTGPSGYSDAATAQRNLIQLLVINRRLRLLPEISRQFDALRAEAERMADVEVISARELGEADAQRLKAALEQRLKRGVRLHPRVDPALVGGAIVRYGDFVVDGSMRGRIERMAVAMSGG